MHGKRNYKGHCPIHDTTYKYKNLKGITEHQKQKHFKIVIALPKHQRNAKTISNCVNLIT